MNSCEQIRTAMMAYDWIGFDLFDTLLLRPFLQPDDLFCQMEQELQVPDFAALRSQTENQLRQGRKRELTFLEIYQAIQQKTGVSDAVIQQWMDLELELNGGTVIRERADFPCIVRRKKPENTSPL